MQKFQTEFNSLHYVLKKGTRFLLVAHNRPDGDTAGATLALQAHLRNLGKIADITCFDPFPTFLEKITSESFSHPDQLELARYDAVIGCDSVERGFKQIAEQLSEKTVTAIIDHHPDIEVTADIVIIDPKKSSACELVYNFLTSNNSEITKDIASYLMLGILSDTGNFQHANTTTRVLEIASELMKKGASFSKIIQSSFASKKLSTLKLWGKAFEKAKINQTSGMIVTALSLKDIAECAATTEDISQVASILNTVPGTKFALVLSEREDGIIKGSLRSEEYKGVDVSAIAHQFGGGGHKLASGFEVNGKIVETKEGWEIV